jgi:hypothetical protein
MTIDEVLVIMQNRLLTLNAARTAAIAAGDLERVNQIDGDLLTTYSSIDQIVKTKNAIT